LIDYQGLTRLSATNTLYICVVNATNNIPESVSVEMVTIPLVVYQAMLDEQSRSRQVIDDLQYRLLKLEQHVAIYKKMLFGSKSERFIGGLNQDQIALHLDLAQAPASEPPVETITYTRPKGGTEAKAGHSRVEFPADLPRKEIIIEPDEDVSGCKCIGEEVTEVLAVRRGEYFVKRIIRRKYARVSGDGIAIGKLPLLPIHKGNADFTLLACIIIAKYIDHLPWYRQAQMMKRSGIIITESTMVGWFRAVCALLEPLYALHKARFLLSGYIQADETPIRVLSRDVPGATHKGYFWVYFDPITGDAVFEYRHGRGQEGPMEFLKDFKGSLQTDGYAAYEVFGRDKDITLLACMAHARRKFDEAKDNDRERAEAMLTMLQELYTIERKAKLLVPDYEAIRELRQTESLPELIKIEAWLKKNLTETLPKSSIGQAIAYTLNLWPRLIRYIEDGRYQIDNNLTENSIRPVAIGRKNYLFAGSHEAAQRAAMIYSFMGTCKQIDINPQDWLEDVLERIPYFKRSDDLSVLLPSIWKTLRTSIGDDQVIRLGV
jgi:transposase